MEILKITILIVIFILIIPINLKVFISYDFVSNIGMLEFKLFKYRLFYVKFFIKNKCINLVNRQLKVISIPLSDNEDIKNYADLNIIIFKKLDIKKIETNFKFGIKDNPFVSTLVIGTYSFFIKRVFDVLKVLKKRAKIITKEECFFQSNILILNFKCSVSLSIIDYFWGILESKTVNIKLGENVKWQKTS